jgi:hypothetical protein
MEKRHMPYSLKYPPTAIPSNLKQSKSDLKSIKTIESEFPSQNPTHL